MQTEVCAMKVSQRVFLYTRKNTIQESYFRMDYLGTIQESYFRMDYLGGCTPTIAGMGGQDESCRRLLYWMSNSCLNEPIRTPDICPIRQKPYLKRPPSPIKYKQSPCRRCCFWDCIERCPTYSAAHPFHFHVLSGVDFGIYGRV